MTTTTRPPTRMWPHARRTTRVLAAVFAGLLLSAGCSSDDTAADPGEDDTSPAVQIPNPETDTTSDGGEGDATGADTPGGGDDAQFEYSRDAAEAAVVAYYTAEWSPEGIAAWVEDMATITTDSFQDSVVAQAEEAEHGHHGADTHEFTGEGRATVRDAEVVGEDPDPADDPAIVEYRMDVKLEAAETPDEWVETMSGRVNAVLVYVDGGWLVDSIVEDASTFVLPDDSPLYDDGVREH